MVVVESIALLWRNDPFSAPRSNLRRDDVRNGLRSDPELLVSRFGNRLLVRRRSGWGGAVPLPVAVLRVDDPPKDVIWGRARIPRYRAALVVIVVLVLLGSVIGEAMSWAAGDSDAFETLASLGLLFVWVAVVAAALRTAGRHFRDLIPAIEARLREDP